ncbi:hypothetical protein ACFFL1_00875 [Samsonia erythrinae]|uniref:hypothetical protein n=1 Tax=Samsonia erythrinae TaxID=160434 RepID=UPI00140559BD|nr:hypothetical protein [Samsonia erythrinae]
MKGKGSVKNRGRNNGVKHEDKLFIFNEEQTDNAIPAMTTNLIMQIISYILISVKIIMNEKYLIRYNPCLTRRDDAENRQRWGSLQKAWAAETMCELAGFDGITICFPARSRLVKTDGPII